MASHPALPGLAADAWPACLWQDLPVLVGVSGGPDSTALLAVLAELRPVAARGSLIAAHFDHGLREDSAEDAAFVEQLAERLDVECAVERAERLDPADHAVEEASRNARYAFFRRRAGLCGARYLATAHTADDQAETVVHRITRGTGIRGLSGIPAVRPLSGLTTIVRPLLQATRGQIERYLAARGLSWREDPTNRDLRHTRNRVRHEVLPLLEQLNPRAREALNRLAAHAADWQRAVERTAETLLDAVAGRVDSTGCDLDCPPLSRADEAVVCETLRLAWRRAGWPEQPMDRTAWQRLAGLARAPADAPPVEFPGAIRAERQGRWLRLAPSHPA